MTFLKKRQLPINHRLRLKRALIPQGQLSLTLDSFSSISLFFVFSINWLLPKKILPTIGFEPGISAVGDYCAALLCSATVKRYCAVLL